MTLATISNPAVIGVLAGCSGVVGLRLGWRRPALAGRLAVGCGWLLLAFAAATSVHAWGGEFGISYVFAGLALCAWVLVLANSEVRESRSEKAAGSPGPPTSRGHKWLTFLAAGPLAALASCQFTLAATFLLPISEMTRMATAALLFPVLWGIVAALTCMLGRPGRAACLFVAVAALSSLVIFF